MVTDSVYLRKLRVRSLCEQQPRETRIWDAGGLSRRLWGPAAPGLNTGGPVSSLSTAPPATSRFPALSSDWGLLLSGAADRWGPVCSQGNGTSRGLRCQDENRRWQKVQRLNWKPPHPLHLWEGQRIPLWGNRQVQEKGWQTPELGDVWTKWPLSNCVQGSLLETSPAHTELISTNGPHLRTPTDIQKSPRAGGKSLTWKTETDTNENRAGLQGEKVTWQDVTDLTIRKVGRRGMLQRRQRK